MIDVTNKNEKELLNENICISVMFSFVALTTGISGIGAITVMRACYLK